MQNLGLSVIDYRVLMDTKGPVVRTYRLKICGLAEGNSSQPVGERKCFFLARQTVGISTQHGFQPGLISEEKTQ